MVRQGTRDGTVVYVLHTAPGMDQYGLPHVKKPPSTPSPLAGGIASVNGRRSMKVMTLSYSGGSP